MSLILFALPVSAQKKSKPSKEEKKAAKAREKAAKQKLKDFKKDLNSFMAFLEAKEEAESQVSSLRGQLNQVQNDLEAAKNGKAASDKQVEDLTSQLAACNARPKDSGFGVPSSGLHYTVQIGAFQEANAPANSGNPEFRKTSEGGFNKYIMGVFNNIGEADALKRFLLELDFRSDPTYRPFIVPYRDGARISMEEALGPEESQRRRQQIQNEGY